jgi:hypothetical protein
MTLMMMNQLVTSPETNIELINVELVDKCLRGLKLGIASGPDGLCTESIKRSSQTMLHLYVLYFVAFYYITRFL